MREVVITFSEAVEMRSGTLTKSSSASASCATARMAT
jgi:hypothetical protein